MSSSNPLYSSLPVTVPYTQLSFCLLFSMENHRGSAHPVEAMNPNFCSDIASFLALEKLKG
jgi:hypothetical protein